MYMVGGRVTLTPYPDLWCDVDTIDSLPVYTAVLTAATAYSEAVGIEDGLGTLQKLYEQFERHARPVWNVCSPKGPIPSTAAAMLLVPIPLVIALVNLWTDTFEASGVPSEPEPDTGSEPAAVTPRRSRKVAVADGR